MTPDERFWSAVQTDDFAGAKAALDAFVAPFRLCKSGLDEITGVRAFLAAAMKTAGARRSAIATEVARLHLLRDGYRRPPSANTWNLVG